MNESHIYVVAYTAEPQQLIRAFTNARRAAEYADMLKRAPFPGQDPAGYTVTKIALN